MLGTVALKTGDAGRPGPGSSARSPARRRPAQEYARAKLLRLAGDAADAGGDHRRRPASTTSPRWTCGPTSASGSTCRPTSPASAWSRAASCSGRWASPTTASSCSPPPARPTPTAPTPISSRSRSCCCTIATTARATSSTRRWPANRIGDYYKVYMALWISPRAAAAASPTTIRPRPTWPSATGRCGTTTSRGSPAGAAPPALSERAPHPAAPDRAGLLHRGADRPD
jgi:hypothetical protein